MQSKEKLAKSICFVGKLSSSFIYSDYELLKKNDYIVFLVEPPQARKSFFLWFIYLFNIFKYVIVSDCIYCWFAGWHSFIAVIIGNFFRKKTIVVAGGYDVGNYPEIKYGAFSKIKEKIPSYFVLKYVDMVLAVSEYTKNEILKNVMPKNICVIYNGVDIEVFSSCKNKKNIILTVGVGTIITGKLKGLETFVKVSKLFQNFDFVIIGDYDSEYAEYLRDFNYDIKLLGKLDHNKIVEWMQKSKIYCQLSYVESFGLSLAEAMSCNCIPIVTERGALKEVVGEQGLIVQYGDVDGTRKAIEKVIDSRHNLDDIRSRIEKNFSIKIREKKLLEILKQI